MGNREIEGSLLTLEGNGWMDGWVGGWWWMGLTIFPFYSIPTAHGRRIVEYDSQGRDSEIQRYRE